MNNVSQCLSSVAMSLAIRVTHRKLARVKLWKLEQDSAKVRGDTVCVCLFSTFNDYIYCTIINCMAQNTNTIQLTLSSTQFPATNVEARRMQTKMSEKASKCVCADMVTFYGNKYKWQGNEWKFSPSQRKIDKNSWPKLKYNKLHFPWLTLWLWFLF